MRRRSPVVALGLTAVLASALTGCATSTTTPADTAPDVTTGSPAAASGPATSTGGLTVDESPAPAEDTGADTGTDGDAAGDATDATDGEAADVEYAGVCVDQQTQERVDDGQCSTLDPVAQTQPVAHGHGSIVPGLVAWYFLRNGLAAPRVGARVAGGSFAAPTTSSFVTGGVPRTGARVSAASVPGSRTTVTRSTVAKGGFGSASKSGSGRVGG